MKDCVRVGEKVAMYEQIFPKLVGQIEGYEARIERFGACWREISDSLLVKDKSIQILKEKVRLLEEECQEGDQAKRELEEYREENKKLCDSLITLEAKLT